MSLVDELREIEQQVNRRLQELEPLVAEYQELRQVAERIGQQPPSAPARAANGKASASAPPSARRRRTRTPSAARPKPAKAATARKTPAATRPAAGRRTGKRDADVIRIVSENPGITVAQIGGQLKVDPTGLYRVVRRLQQAGQINKSGTGLTPAAAK